MDQFETEEQQVEAIKRFWKENGTALIIGAIVGLGSLWGWRYYNDSQIAAKEAASLAYEKANEQGADPASAQSYIDANTDSGYALLMALELSKKAVEEKDFAAAEKQLQFVIDNSQVVTVKSIAQLRLARIQLEQGNLEQALATAETVQDEAFSGSSEEIKGDVYLAQKLFDKARAAYSAALEKNERNPVLQMKLDNLAELANG